MTQQPSLTAIFESNKEQLKNQLSGLLLPDEISKIQEIVSSYFSEILDTDGTYRQSLTQSEDYILQAAYELINAQLSLSEHLSVLCRQCCQSDDNLGNNHANYKKQSPLLLFGTAVGGYGGALCFPNWGAIFGAIAGTALSMYVLHTISGREINTSSDKNEAKAELNLTQFINEVQNLCTKIDALMDTFRVQMDRLNEAYSNLHKASRLTDFGTLLQKMEEVFKAFDSDETDRMETLSIQMNLLKRSLLNYGLEYKEGKIITK